MTVEGTWTDRWDAPTEGLGARARRGVKQTAILRILSLVTQFVGAAILARILGPAAFGTIALATVVTAFAAIFNDMGIGSALVQRPKLDEAMLSAAFWLNLLVGFVLTAAICALAPIISSFFDAESLTAVLQLSSLTLLLSVTLVQRSLLQRQMKFGAVMGLDFLFGFVSVISSVLLAVAGVGVFAVPIGAIIATVVSGIVAVALCPWFPRHAPTRTAFGVLWNYSASLLSFNVINYIGKNIDNLLVGKFLGATPLGLYSRAYNLMQLPVVNLTRILGTVMFPALSTLQKEPVRFRRGWLLGTKTAVVLGTWTAIVTAVSATPLVQVVYGSEWIPMAGALAILMAAVPAYILASNASPVFLALGETGLQFKLGLVTVTLRIASIVIGLQFGYVGVAWGLLVSSYLNIAVTTVPAMKLAGIPLLQALSELKGLMAAALVAVCGGLIVVAVIESWPAIAIVVAVTTTCTTLFALVLFLVDRQFIRTVRDR